MSLNIKNDEVVALAREVAEMANESQTEAIRVALQQRKIRLQLEGIQSKRDRIMTVLEEKIWPSIPPEFRGKRITREEEDEILGYGPDGV